MVIYNTMTRRKEELTLAGDELKIYLCGPTVYNFIHVGNARTLCVFDVFRRYLAYRGVPVKFVMNFTDIDDRIIARANEEGVSAKEYAERYIAEFLKDCEGLGVLPPNAAPKATESIDIILDMIAGLIKKGYAYAAANGDVYFRTKRFGEYGKLSHQNVDELEEGVRIEVDDIKEDPLDFALWKAAKPGEPSWDSPYSKGRPGWHIECSAMSKKFLGETVDIHGGGLDLVFPHHENEIAQSECCNNAVFSRYWMHVAMLNIDNRKMSKSLGNFFTVREVAEEYNYELIRYFLINAHYRSQVNFTREAMDSCATSVERLRNARRNLQRAIERAEKAGSDDLAQKAESRREQFIASMEDDLNTADAIAAIFEFARDINSAEGQSKAALETTAAVFDELCGVLGILRDAVEEEVPQEILNMANERQQARADRDFARADALRDEIVALGYVLEDTKDGPVVKKNRR